MPHACVTSLGPDLPALLKDSFYQLDPKMGILVGKSVPGIPEDFIEVPILECEMAAPISVRRLLGRSPLPQDSFDLSTIPYLHLGCSGRWECAHTRAAAGEPLSPVSQATGAERAVLLVQQALCRHCGRQDRLQKAVEVKSQ